MTVRSKMCCKHMLHWCSGSSCSSVTSFLGESSSVLLEFSATGDGDNDSSLIRFEGGLAECMLIQKDGMEFLFGDGTESEEIR